MSHGPFGKRVERLPVAQGGTAASTPDEARKQLGVPSLTENNTFAGDQVVQGLLEADQLHANLSVTTDGTVVIEEGTIDAALLTGSQAYQLPDKSGTFAMLSDVGGLADGDYGDIVVSGSGTVMTVDPAATIEAAGLVAGDVGLSVKGGDVGIYAVFDASPLVTESRAYMFPDASGTFVLSGEGSPHPANFSYFETSDAYTLTSANVIVRSLAGATITLPSAITLGAGKTYLVKNGSATVTMDVLATAELEYIDENTTATLAALGFVWLVSNGVSKWAVIGAQGVTLSGGYD